MNISEFCSIICPYLFINEKQNLIDLSTDEFFKISILPNDGNSHDLNVEFKTSHTYIPITFRKAFGFKKNELSII